MPDSKHLTIVQLNDTHAYFNLHPELFWGGNRAEYQMAGGYARIATILKEARQERPGEVLALDCGDTIHGTFAAVETKGQALVPILNSLKLDAMTAHWEFAYGPQRFREIVDQLTYPMLAINCYDKHTHRLVFNPYTIRDVNGLRVGVIGIAATIVDKTMPPHFSEGIYFTLGNEELPRYLTTLRQDEQVDLIVVLSHLGFPQDMKLVEEVKGIDILLSAHTHNRLYKPVQVGGTLIIQSGCHGSFLGRLDLTVASRQIVDWHHRLIVVDDKILPDADTQALIDGVLAPYKDYLEQVAGHTVTALNRNTMLESTMDNLLLQSLLNATHAELAFSNGWRYGAPVLPGPVTVNDLYNIIPANPPVSTANLTGEELWTMLEENLEHTFSSDPYHQMGGYVKRCLGITVYFKVEHPAGHRIQQLFVQDEPVRLDRSYAAVYVTRQGIPAKYGTNHKNLDLRAIQALESYLAGHNPVEAALRGTFVAI